MRLRLTPQAVRDVRSARRWYRQQGTPSLADRFTGELERTYTFILDNPHAYQTVEDDVRRAVLRVFPYIVYYVPRESTIVVLAVLHGSQHPETWKRRR